MFYGIFFAVSSLCAVLLSLVTICKKDSLVIEKIAKVTVVVWMSLYFLNLFLPDGLVLRAYDDISHFKDGENTWVVLLRWCNDLAFLVLPVAVFFKKELFVKITGYFLLLACLVNVGIYCVNIEFFTSPLGAGIAEIRFLSDSAEEFFRNQTFRGIWYGILSFLELMLIVFVITRNINVFKQKPTKKSFLVALGVFLMLFFSIMPIYAPQYIFKGYSLLGANAFDNFKMASPFHIIWIIGVIIEGVVLTKLFKNKSYEDRYIVVLMLALSLVMQYNQMFTCVGEITTHRMPFQLCNMAGFFILLMLLTKNQRIYHFTLVINSVGAIIAMVLCDTTAYGLAYVMNIHYVVEHTNVILAPILCATLGLFPKLKNKHVIDFVVGFALYFTFILLVGGTFTGIKELGGPNADYWNCNYLFMFNKAETSKIVGFVAPLFDIKVKLFNFFTLSMIQLVVFASFTAICTGVFFLMRLLPTIIAKLSNVQNALVKKLTKKSN
ncbi:MAG: YwaF family protein [Clostridia bacterium]|nr:YwaF family protein [Clostridia bacterium]